MKSRIVFAYLCVVALCYAEASSGNGSGGFPDVDELKNTFESKYDSPVFRWKAFVPKIADIEKYRETVDARTVEASEEYVLQRIFAEPVATLDDIEGREKINSSIENERYLLYVSQWRSMRSSTNALMRIADWLSNYAPLPSLEGSEVMLTAHRLDDYIEYGTNVPPKRTGMIWNGPLVNRISKMRSFRRLYNSGIVSMRKSALSWFYCAIIEGFADLTKGGKETLWKEFARRAKATEDEVAYAEGGRLSTTRGVGQ